MVMEPSKSKFARADAFTRLDERGIEVEREVGVFVGELVYLIKPRVSVWVGAVSGLGLEHAASVLVDNALVRLGGHLWAFETNKRVFRELEQRQLPHTTCVLGGLRDADGLNRVDLAFIDGDYDERVADVRFLAGKMSPKGVLLVHDTMLQQVKAAHRAFSDVMNVVDLPTPRGLSLIQPRGNLWGVGIPL